MSKLHKLKNALKTILSIFGPYFLLQLGYFLRNLIWNDVQYPKTIYTITIVYMIFLVFWIIIFYIIFKIQSRKKHPIIFECPNCNQKNKPKTFTWGQEITFYCKFCEKKVSISPEQFIKLQNGDEESGR